MGEWENGKALRKNCRRDRRRPRHGPRHCRAVRAGRRRSRDHRPFRRITAELGEADILAYGREHLAGYKIPRSVTFAEEIPRNASGKILKKLLREPFWAGRASKV